MRWLSMHGFLTPRPNCDRRRASHKRRIMSETNIIGVVLRKVRAANLALIDEGVLPAGTDQSRIVVEPPRGASHGDLATNAAMVLAKEARKKPGELAREIIAKLRGDDLFTAMEVAGPGFINFTLKPAAWVEALRTAL